MEMGNLNAKSGRPRLPLKSLTGSMTPEQRQQKDDRQRHAEEPQQGAFSKSHVFLLRPGHRGPFFKNVRVAYGFPLAVC